MASPADNVQALQALWGADGDVLSAGVAMRELVAQAGKDRAVRLGTFAAASIFETALIADSSSGGDQALDVVQGYTSLAFTLGLDGPPRQTMLDGIWAAGNGGLFDAKDPSGLTSWVHAVDVAAGAVVGTLKGDPNAQVRIALLRCIRDLAIPAFWATFFKQQQVFETLDAQLPRTTWSANATADLALRKTLQALTAGAKARVDGALAQLALAGAASPTGWAAFPTGDGATAITTPAPPKAWYRNGWLWLAAAGGVTGGAAAHIKLAR